jgi:hypothetical protein
LQKLSKNLVNGKGMQNPDKQTRYMSNLQESNISYYDC